jgi:hypothetical protein
MHRPPSLNALSTRSRRAPLVAPRPAPPAVSGILELQRLAGNQAVARLITSQSGRRLPGPVVQRAVVLLDVTPDDYALQKVLVRLEPSKHTMLDSASQVWSIKSSWLPEMAPKPPFLIPYKSFPNVATQAEKDQTALVTKSEDIHVVGHGGYGGRVWTAPNHGDEVTDFTELARDVKRITPRDWTGSVKIRTCYSDAGDASYPSVVEKTKAALGHGRVAGYAGFAYGMGTHRPGQSLVLKREFDALYKADKYKERVAKHLLAQARSDEDARKSISLTLDASSSEEDQQKAAWDAFVTRMKALEEEMKNVVKRYGDQSPLERAKKLEADSDFAAAIRSQHELFAAFDLWQ